METKWTNFYQQIGMSYVISVGITVVLRVILFFHWMTFIYYQIPQFGMLDYNNSTWLKHVHKLENEPMVIRYKSCLFYVCGLIIGAGYQKPKDEYLVVELIANSILAIIGLVFLLYSFTTLLRLAIYNRYEIFLYNGWLKELQEYMIFKQLPHSLQRKIQLFINSKYSEHYYNERSIMNTINEQIKQDINMHCCKRLVLNVPLFQDLPLPLMNAIVFSLKQVFYMPGEVRICLKL
jgi:hyperpolarization activated cyclic nucleotide-gated potassium channel 2